MFFMQEVTENDYNAFLATDPELRELALCDDLLNVWNEYGAINLMGSAVVGVWTEEALANQDLSAENMVGCVQCERFTPETVCIHTFLSTKFRKTGLYKNIYPELEDYFRAAGFCNIMSYAPKCHKVATGAMTKVGFAISGIIPNGIVWRNEFTDVVIFSKCLF